MTRGMHRADPVRRVAHVGYVLLILAAELALAGITLVAGKGGLF